MPKHGTMVEVGPTILWNGRHESSIVDTEEVQDLNFNLGAGEGVLLQSYEGNFSSAPDAGESRLLQAFTMDTSATTLTLADMETNPNIFASHMVSFDITTSGAMQISSEKIFYYPVPGLLLGSGIVRYIAHRINGGAVAEGGIKLWYRRVQLDDPDIVRLVALRRSGRF